MDCCTAGVQCEAPVNEDEALSLDPVNTPAPEYDINQSCVSCSGPSRPVTRKTMLLMLRPEHFSRVEDSDYRFCSDTDCRVVYFSQSSGVTFYTNDLRIRVGVKERVDPVPLCYCFGFDEQDARAEIARTGSSSIPQRITELIKQKLCACPERNPSGTCCLGDVSNAVKRLIDEKIGVK